MIGLILVIIPLSEGDNDTVTSDEDALYSIQITVNDDETCGVKVGDKLTIEANLMFTKCLTMIRSKEKQETQSRPKTVTSSQYTVSYTYFTNWSFLFHNFSTNP